MSDYFWHLLLKKILSSRTEILFSRQGYNYKSGTKTDNVNLDYIHMGQLMAINITKYISLMFGGSNGLLGKCYGR